MKENLKNKKGITLIALVITIIVLLILAIVTIRIMTNQNIIGHANNAVTSYNEAQNNESEQLTWAEQLMKNYKGSGTTTPNNQNNMPGNYSTTKTITIEELFNSFTPGEDTIFDIDAAALAKKLVVSTDKLVESFTFQEDYTLRGKIESSNQSIHNTALQVAMSGNLDTPGIHFSYGMESSSSFILQFLYMTDEQQVFNEGAEDEYTVNYKTIPLDNVMSIETFIQTFGDTVLTFYFA